MIADTSLFGVDVLLDKAVFPFESFFNANGFEEAILLIILFAVVVVVAEAFVKDSFVADDEGVFSSRDLGSRKPSKALIDAYS